MSLTRLFAMAAAIGLAIGLCGGFWLAMWRAARLTAQASGVLP